MDTDQIEEEILPVEEFKDELMSHVKHNQIVICIGETGSGKTTRIPQFFLDADILSGKSIAVTQPRRVAAITVAQRVADERNVNVGDEVGYTVRFDDSTSSRTRIKFMTDGILVRECLSSSTLSQYQAVMLDEAHERSIHTDILFGLVKKACEQRPDLKVLITSATLDVSKFSSYFNNCPVVRVPGRLFPVDLYHSKTKQVMTTSGPATNSYVDSAVNTVLRIHSSQDDGHILVFLTGQEEIERACDMIRKGVQEQRDGALSELKEILVVPLYASLPAAAQKKAFQPCPRGMRKCVVATNIAETSVTVPGIRYVIDPGYVKQKAYDPARSVMTASIVPSLSDNIQADGISSCGAYFSSISSTTCRTSRQNRFEFMDPPSEQQIVEGLVMLHMLGAIDDNGRITPSIGRGMAAYPLEPSLSRMMVEAQHPSNDCLEEVAIICAMLSVENVYFFPRRMQQGEERERARREMRESKGRVGSADEELAWHAVEDAHAKLRHSKGDHFTYLNIFLQWERSGSVLMNEAEEVYNCSFTGYDQDWCERHYIRHRAMKTAKNIRNQLLSDAEKAKDDYREEGGDRKRQRRGADEGRREKERIRAIQRSLTAGLFMNAARRCANETAYRSLSFKVSHESCGEDSWQLKDMLEEVKLLHIHPTSCFGGDTGNRPPEYIIYQVKEDLMHSNRALMRHVVKIDYETLERFRSDWSFVNPLLLSGRQVPRSNNEVKSQETECDRESVDNTSSSHAGGGTTEKLSAVDAARARYLKRKMMSNT